MIKVSVFQLFILAVLNILLNAVNMLLWLLLTEIFPLFYGNFKIFLAAKFPEVPFSFVFIFSVKIHTFSVIQYEFWWNMWKISVTLQKISYNYGNKMLFNLRRKLRYFRLRINEGKKKYPVNFAAKKFRKFTEIFLISYFWKLNSSSTYHRKMNKCK